MTGGKGLLPTKKKTEGRHLGGGRKEKGHWENREASGIGSSRKGGPEEFFLKVYLEKKKMRKLFLKEPGKTENGKEKKKKKKKQRKD